MGERYFSTLGSQGLGLWKREVGLWVYGLSSQYDALSTAYIYLGLLLGMHLLLSCSTLPPGVERGGPG